MKEIQLSLKLESWKNMFKVIRNSNIKSEGNFWASIQHLEETIEEESKNGNACKTTN